MSDRQKCENWPRPTGFFFFRGFNALGFTSRFFLVVHFSEIPKIRYSWLFSSGRTANKQDGKNIIIQTAGSYEEKKKPKRMSHRNQKQVHSCQSVEIQISRLTRSHFDANWSFIIPFSEHKHSLKYVENSLCRGGHIVFRVLFSIERCCSAAL